MSNISDRAADQALARCLPLGDDALIASQRLAGWIAKAPTIEEDVAIANIGLDLLGQARLLLAYAGSLGDPPRTEDELAYLRDEREFRNCQLVERPLPDFAVLVTRMLLFSSYQLELYRGLAQAPGDTVAEIAAKAVKEVDYHRDHARQWTLRLGDGTEESHRRMAVALEDEWPYLAELEPTDEARAFIVGTLTAAGLAVPEVPDAVTGGRHGVHTETFGLLLAEMQHLTRSHPGARW